MKKVNLILMVVLMLLLTSCNTTSKKEQSKETGGSSPTTDSGLDASNTAESNSKDTKVNSDTVDKRLNDEYEDTYLSKFTILLPGASLSPEKRISSISDYFLFKEGGGRLVLTKYFIDTFEKSDAENCDLSKIKSSEDILDNLIYKVSGCVRTSYELINYTKDVVKTETINGLEMTKFTGNIRVGNGIEEDGSYVAYGIMGSDGRPYLILALDQTEGKENLEEWSSLLDAMMPTFKENPTGEGMSLE